MARIPCVPAGDRREEEGSEQEFDEGRILGRFLDDYEFGPSRRRAPRLEQQIPQILVAARLRRRRVLILPLMASTTPIGTFVRQ